jgi:hypothetical protein
MDRRYQLSVLPIFVFWDVLGEHFADSPIAESIWHRLGRKRRVLTAMLRDRYFLIPVLRTMYTNQTAT